MEGTCDHHLVQLPSPGLQPLQQKRAMLSTGEWGVLGRFRSLGRGLPGKAPDPLVLAVPPVCYVKPIHPLCFLTLYAGSRAPWLGAGVDPGLSCWDKEENSQVNESGFTAVRRLKEEGKKSQPMLRDLHGAAPRAAPLPGHGAVGHQLVFGLVSSSSVAANRSGAASGAWHVHVGQDKGGTRALPCTSRALLNPSSDPAASVKLGMEGKSPFRAWGSLQDTVGFGRQGERGIGFFLWAQTVMI